MSPAAVPELPLREQDVVHAARYLPGANLVRAVVRGSLPGPGRIPPAIPPTTSLRSRVVDPDGRMDQRLWSPPIAESSSRAESSRCDRRGLSGRRYRTHSRYFPLHWSASILAGDREEMCRAPSECGSVATLLVAGLVP